MRQDMSVQVSAQEDSWGTPSHIAARVRNVFGGIIDLDAASSVESNTIIQANRIFTVDDDALTKDWIAENVFLNPPYGKVGNASKAGLFAQKAIAEYSKGHFKEGIILLHSRFGYGWFESLMDTMVSATLKERLRFIDPKTLKPAAQAKTSQTLFYLGKDADRFIDEFKKLGRINNPKPKRFTFVQDESSHTYLIDSDDLTEFDSWVEATEDGLEHLYEGKDYNEFRVEGGLFTFIDPKVE